MGGKYFLKESDEQNSTIILSQLNKEKIEDGISAFYEATQNGKMVPVSLHLFICPGFQFLRSNACWETFTTQDFCIWDQCL